MVTKTATFPGAENVTGQEHHHLSEQTGLWAAEDQAATGLHQFALSRRAWSGHTGPSSLV